MIRSLMLLLLLASSSLHAAHITDKLLAGVYKMPDKSSEAIIFLSSGAPLEVIEVKNKYTKVRTSDDTIGWVQSRYVTEELPTNARLIDVQERLANMRRELKTTQTELSEVKAQKAAMPVINSEMEDNEKIASLNNAIKRRDGMNTQLSNEIKALKKQSEKTGIHFFGIDNYKFQPEHALILLGFMLSMLLLGYFIKSSIVRRKFSGFKI